MSNIKKSLDKLSLEDTSSLILFVLYILKDVPSYAVLSELVYLVDKKSLYNLLDYFGGMTIQIPTRQELDTVIDALLVFNKIMYDNMEVEQAFKELNINDNKESIIEAYKTICEVLAKYDFKR